MCVGVAVVWKDATIWSWLKHCSGGCIWMLSIWWCDSVKTSVQQQAVVTIATTLDESKSLSLDRLTDCRMSKCHVGRPCSRRLCVVLAARTSLGIPDLTKHTGGIGGTWEILKSRFWWSQPILNLSDRSRNPCLFDWHNLTKVSYRSDPWKTFS